MRFFLNFKSDNYGKKQIDEPFGVDGIDFSLKQENKRMARDVSFSGGEAEFEFTDKAHHELKQLLYYHSYFGFEAKVVLTLEIAVGDVYNVDLDFATASTDGLTYFKCKGIEDSKLQIIKARKSVKVDLLSSKDVDGNIINPITTQNILMLAKPIIQSSKWEQSSDFNITMTSTEAVDSRNFYKINPATNLVKYGIDNSYTFYSNVQKTPISVSENPFELIKCKNNLNKVKININNIDIDFSTDVDNGGNGYVEFRLMLAYGSDIDTAQLRQLIVAIRSEHETFSYFGNLAPEINGLNRGDSVWLWYDFKVVQSAGSVLTTPRFECFFNSRNLNIEVSAESIAYNSIAKSVRLIDVMAQVIRSISGLEIDAERFGAAGEFYQNRLVNGDFLRGISENGFKVSLEDIENSLGEFKADYEIGSNGKVFFGIEADYYENTEIEFFDDTQFESMQKSFNPKYMVNEFSFKYKNYQSLKENEEPNSADTIHGEYRGIFFNKNVENKKEVTVEWTRDAFLIDVTRRKAIELTEKTASQDDDTVFIIDTVETNTDRYFSEVTQIQHTYDANNQRLVLRNDSSVNFLSLGISIDTVFKIEEPDQNQGAYRVFFVTNNTIELTKITGAISPQNNGDRLTKYTYFISKTTVPFTNYTNQGFSDTQNLNVPDNYGNRRYSIKRNIYNYWRSYLATCNLYWKDKPLINTWYKNNGEYSATYNGVNLKENADFLPDNPILSPVLYTEMIFKNVSFSRFIKLQSKIRSQRGYIRTTDNNQQVIKVYPSEISYKLLDMELVIKKAEEKYEPTYMTISTESGYVLVNNETRVSNFAWEVKNEKLYLFDENRFRLYNGVFWFKVSINGAIPLSLEQLKEWLLLIN